MKTGHLEILSTLILPDWPAPARVQACCTTREGGVSRAPYGTLNLGDHVGDDPAAVAENRARLVRALGLPEMPRWLNQVHGCAAVNVAEAPPGCSADVAYTDRPGIVCAVLTADCLPVLLCDRQGTRVAAIHAGWRGLAAGAIEAGVRALGVSRKEILAWLGPAIGPQAFEVGAEVRKVFVGHDPLAARAFRPAPGGRWLADLHVLAQQRLAECGVTAVYGDRWCTYSEPARFFSYRRDGATGRMATIIWLGRDGDAAPLRTLRVQGSGNQNFIE
ncbi:MAG: peptidoglycan editing factor PgeF [Gammaproteobacteria bacterium]